MKADNTMRKSADDFFKEQFYSYNPYREVKRQLFHLFLGLFIVFIVILTERLYVAIFLTIILIVGGILSLLTKMGRTSILDVFLEHFDRDDDRKMFPGKGAFFFIFGSAITLFIFPADIAIAGILVLTVGDSMSHLAGRYIKKNFRNDGYAKVIEGNLVGIIVSSLAASFFIDPLFAFIGSAIAMSLEATEDVMFNLDDNFYIPIVASFVIFVVRLIFG